jgi:hypothetical protein
MVSQGDAGRTIEAAIAFDAAGTGSDASVVPGGLRWRQR